jgi:hypothetical protein
MLERGCGTCGVPKGHGATLVPWVFLQYCTGRALHDSLQGTKRNYFCTTGSTTRYYKNCSDVGSWADTNILYTNCRFLKYYDEYGKIVPGRT